MFYQHYQKIKFEIVSMSVAVISVRFSKFRQFSNPNQKVFIGMIENIFFNDMIVLLCSYNIVLLLMTQFIAFNIIYRKIHRDQYKIHVLVVFFIVLIEETIFFIFAAKHAIHGEFKSHQYSNFL